MDKREDYITWDEYFMGIAFLSAERSKDPSSIVGACIVDNENKILSIGYNGAPNGYDDDEHMTWKREGSFLETKYAYVCHSEENAIINYPGNKKDLKDAKIYVTLFPCNECAKIIIQSGIKEVIYACDKYNGTDSNIASKKMFDVCGVKYSEYKKTGKKINIEL